MCAEKNDRVWHEDENSMNALQVFEPDAWTVYTIEMVAQLAEVPRQADSSLL